MTEINREQKTIARGAFWSIFGTVAVKGISFIYVVVLAHLMSQDQIGDFYLVISILGLFTIFSNLGISTSFNRYIPYFYGKKQFKKLKILIDLGFFVAPVIPLIVSTIVFFNANLIAEFFDNFNLIPLLKIMSVYIFLDAMFRLGSSFLAGRKRINYVRTSAVVQAFSKLILTLILFYLIGINTYVLAYAFLLSFVFGASYSLIRSYYEIKKIDFGNITETRTDYVTIAKEIVPFGLIIALITSMWMIISYSDRLMIGYFLPPDIASVQIAVYSMALGIAKLTLIFTTSISVIFFPVISELFGKGDKIKMKKITDIAIKWLMLISIPIAMLLILFSTDFLNIFYGSEYESGYLVLILFSVGLLIRGIGSIPGLLLASMRKLDIELKIMVLAVIVNVVMNLLLIPEYGINGAAFASLCSFIFLTFLLGYYSGKIAGFRFPNEAYKLLFAGIVAFGLLLLIKPFLWSFLDETFSNIIMLGVGEGGLLEEILQKVAKLLIFGVLFLICCWFYFILVLALKLFGSAEIEILDAVLKKGKIPEKHRKWLKNILEAEYLPDIPFLKS